MLLTEYLAGIAEIINEYSETGLVLSSELMADSRTEKIGMIKGTLIFIDDSKLFKLVQSCRLNHILKTETGQDISVSII